MRRLLLALPLLLAACAQDAGAPAFNPIGMTEPELIGRLGVPSRSHDTEGRRFLTWETAGRQAVVVPSIGVGVGRFGGGWGSGTAVGTGLGLSFGGGGGGSCITTYELREGRVIGVQQAGSGC